VRRRIVARDNYRCVVCKSFVGAVGAARVDHILSLKQAPSRALDPTNLRTLCAQCDNRAREHGTTRTERFVYGSDQRGLPLDPRHGWASWS
jgi:5-methylcytosine-specific restriction endonuclease McrA